MKENSAAYYDIENKIFNSRQGTLSITEYYGTLNGLWIELDQYQGLKMCKADSVAYTRFVERGRIFRFLHGLNFECDPIRVQILGKEKLSSLSEVFFIVRSEETRRSIMLDKGNSNTGSTMVTRKGATKRSTSKEKPFTKSSRGEYCTYCKQSGHTKDTCYKRYGKEKVLERMGGNKGSTQMWVNQTTSNKENGVEHPSTLQLDQDIQAFSKEEMDRLRALLNSTSKPLGSCGLTMNGKSSFNISGSVPQSIWILDSGATDHMTPFPSHFTSYLKVPKRQLITIANGDHVPIVGSGNVQLHSSLSLHNELTTGRTIGVAKEQGGLYNLQHTKIVYRQPHKLGQLLKFGFIINILDIHQSVESFKCDICQFSKHYRATFSPSNNKSLEPFDLIHFDVWGAASNSILGAKWFVSFIDDCTHVTWIFLMKHKYEVCQIFVDFFYLVKNQFNKSIKRLRSDNGTEFLNIEFSKFLKDNGVVHGLTCVNTP
ncbi:hypothetical protein CR513_14060, partial [Mucuna pruriens]